MKLYIIILSIFSVSILTACGNLEKEIDLELPFYESQYVIECYLEPGEHFRLALSRSVPYFEPFPEDPSEFVSSILVDSAEVVISHAGKEYVLNNEIDIVYFLNKTKVYNYYLPESVPVDYNSDFLLRITTPDGKVITGKTRLLPPVPIDSIIVEFDLERDTLARVLTYLTDDPAQNNYYRRMLHVNSLDSIPDQDFVTNDDFVDNKTIAFGSSFEFEEGDTVYNTLFHIDRAYYDFWNSTFNAVNANGNPFGQPSGIVSNVSGGVGIFTGLSYDQVVTVVKK
ncbi:MAG: hypothetical protein RI973_192 [Bacteroidota bacterium]|jgi:hypothetical protein